MIAKKSPFVLKNFLLLKQNIEFIPFPNDNGKKIKWNTDAYVIDIDFNIEDSEKPFFQIFIKLEINQIEKKESGYSIFSEGVGIFEFDKVVENDDAAKGDYLYFSGLSICINSLRAIISNSTSNYPIGKYILPTIDINELLKDKGIIKV